MSARWFRFYTDAMRHPKVAKLSDAQFRLWVELLSVAAENDGHIPSADDLKHMLKRRLDHLLRGLDDLIRASLIEPLGGGYKPHGWDKRQYKSDVSTDRVRKHRKIRNVSETPPEAEADTEAAKAASAREQKTDDPEIAVSLAHKLSVIAGCCSPDHGRIVDQQLVVRGWLALGHSPDWLAELITARAAACRSKPRSLRYFDGAVRDAAQARKQDMTDAERMARSILQRTEPRSAAA